MSPESGGLRGATPVKRAYVRSGRRYGNNPCCNFTGFSWREPGFFDRRPELEWPIDVRLLAPRTYRSGERRYWSACERETPAYPCLGSASSTWDPSGRSSSADVRSGLRPAAGLSATFSATPLCRLLVSKEIAPVDRTI